MNEYIYMKKNVIYLNDWLAIHPYTTVCSSDTFFVELANKLYATHWKKATTKQWDRKCMKLTMV
jgi:hypothetical protein